ncbi:MAG: hypothetical protein EBZ22_08290 [Flavobacteriia bacterium]|nr:hypothetical protein [Flavobacteriia bacterium]
MEFIQVFSAVAIGGIFGWLSGYYRGMKDEESIALEWAAKMDKRLGGALLREAKKMHTDITEEIEGIKR